jgi:TPP-dependent 2-oxoacid decarboxylase
MDAVYNDIAPWSFKEIVNTLGGGEKCEDFPNQDERPSE